MQRMTETPGTQAYMPPEVMIENPQYGVSVDEFSFGALMVHVFTAEWPAPKLPQTRVDPANPHNVIAVTEVERREYFFRKIGQEHPLMDLITRCLSNNPNLRPHAPELVGRTTDLVLHFPASFENRVEMLRRISAYDAEKRRLEQEVQRKVSLLEEKEREIGTVQHRLEREHQDEIERITLAHSVQVERLQLQLDDKKNTVSSVNFLLAQKEAIIERLNSQLVRTTDYLASNPKVTLTFSQCSDTPNGIVLGKSVLIGDNMYYGGGGFTDTNQLQELRLIYCYNTSRSRWSALPPHPYTCFGLGPVNGKLVTVGGADDYMVRKDMYQYGAGGWADMGSPMPTSRYHPTVLSHQSCLIVAGGNTSRWRLINTNKVEIYNTSISQWKGVASLLGPSMHLSGGIYKENIYLFGGRDDEKRLNHTLVASIDQLLQEPQIQPWRELSNTPAYWPAAVVSTMILTIGGYESPHAPDNRKLTSIHGYSFSRGSWIHIGDLPAPLSQATVTALSPTEFLIIGGRDSNSDFVRSMYKCTIQTIY